MYLRYVYKGTYSFILGLGFFDCLESTTITEYTYFY